MDAAEAARNRLDPRSKRGHYESWFVRGNAPASLGPELGRRAFWIRYTSFVPRGEDASSAASHGELWAIWFDGARSDPFERQVAVRSKAPLDRCSFSSDGLGVRIADATLSGARAAGAIPTPAGPFAWDLQISPNSAAAAASPVLLFPEALYRGALPKAKALCIAPNVQLSGSVTVHGVPHAIDGWLGSVNHNWGSRHTDRYAWGQVAGFDDAGELFLECASARIRIGPMLSPQLSPIALRLGDRDLPFQSAASLLSTKASVSLVGDELLWTLVTAPSTQRGRAVVTFRAPRRDFVALSYPNPPGGTRTCLNTKIARCELRLEQGSRVLHATSQSAAAFEILTDHGFPAEDPGIPVRV